MNLRSKVGNFFAVMLLALIAALSALGVYSFRQATFDAATAHLRSAAEVVRVALTEAMINGVIAKREGLLRRLVEVEGLRDVRVVRGQPVERQFGRGLGLEATADEVERRVLADGRPHFEMSETAAGMVVRGTIPFTATARGTPNCLQCHQVAEGDVLGAVTLSMSVEHLRRQSLQTLGLMIAAVGVFGLLVALFLNRLIAPISQTAQSVEAAVRRAIAGDYRAEVSSRTHDEIGQIATDMNRLLRHLDEGLTRIGGKVAQLMNRPASQEGDLLAGTVAIVDTLAQAAQFKQAIEEDESKAEIYERLGAVIENRFGVSSYSLYEVNPGKNQMLAQRVDGEAQAACRWCDPQIVVRADACRVRRTGHIIESGSLPGICNAFAPGNDGVARVHLCFPILQSGSVGGVLQLVLPAAERARIGDLIPSLGVYLREAAPVLEAKRLMESLRESTLRDPMTGLHNRRFLEEAVEMLVAQVQRRKISLSILMLDLDYFKMVNDSYGHDAGDAVLKALARVLVQSVRASDYVIRYGGEEFLIILQETAAERACTVAENIRAAVEAMKVPVPGGVLEKTISIGLAEFPTDSDTFWQSVKFADVALYHAKDTGRNRVVRFRPELWTEPKDY